MAKKRKPSSKKKEISLTNDFLMRDEKWNSPNDVGLSKEEEERIELAKKFNINLARPKQSKRIKALFELYEENLNKSKLSSFLYSRIIDSSNKLVEIYKKQRSEIQKLDSIDENVEFIKRRLAYVINRYRAQVDTAYAEIERTKTLLSDYNKRKINPSELIPESKEELTRLGDVAWNHYLKAIDINKELRNTIIGYENRLCLYKVGKLFLDYKIYVKQELNQYREHLLQLNEANEYEFNEILRHFELPPAELAKFQEFLKAKMESKLVNAQGLKVAFDKFYDFDVKQIDRMVQEIREQQEKDFKQLIYVINHYKRMLLKKQTKANDDLNELIQYAKKCYIEKVAELKQSLMLKEEMYSNDKSYLSSEEIELLLELNRKELAVRIEQLKHKFTNRIKPLTDDFNNMEMLIERDYVFDKRKLKEQLAQLKFLENKNVEKLTQDFNERKAKLIELFDDRYNFIKSDIEYLRNDFEKTIEQLKTDVEGVAANILEQHEHYWTNVNLEFNSEIRKFLTKFHYESAPWTHNWKGGDRGWMHDYLLINLSAEYLNHVGESLKGFSPEHQLYTNIGKALIQFNEKTRELYKVRDEIEFEQLIRLNTIPAVDVSSIKQTFNQSLVTLKNEETNYQKTLKTFLASLKDRN
ncbi:hypothetical protein J2Z62_000468 [Mycoplasmoides fastidiosum]|uniref:Uncharacterized protein n=1 Tax=Mycoplasmoides fastidiosum TaxID=92758 RepID=A0ABU0LZA3_9BACT|nr:hypothetical protein [Mycoplasmoides fastidiosum]MDQ0514030.1 hypothetical protein [Mycoplasmoides fastidiosum]UUD37560.1 hypothetical protein NPA10_03265 [Mycoplasmoides fastidiosum]